MTEENAGCQAAHYVQKAPATVGGGASDAATWVITRGTRAGMRRRPWMEFIDFSALKLVAAGTSEYIERLNANANYVRFNYLQVGLGLALLSTITRPLCLLSTLCVVAA